jgi:hypothetical protein
LVYENRGSEKVVTAFTSVAISAFAAVCLAVFLFGGQQGIDSTFPVCFFVDKGTGLPVSLQGRPATDIGPHLPGLADTLKAQPSLYSEWDKHGPHVYHVVLQRLILDLMFSVYSESWKITFTNYDLPFFELTQIRKDNSPVLSKTFSVRDISLLFDSGDVGHRSVLFKGDENPILHMPPKTEITIEAPKKADKFGNEIGKITIRNRYCAISIETRQVLYAEGIGEYALLGEKPTIPVERIESPLYDLTFHAEFSRWLAGNPELPQYKVWATTMLAVLEGDFNEEKILSVARERHLHKGALRKNSKRPAF